MSPFSMQKESFYTSKRIHLKCKRTPFFLTSFSFAHIPQIQCSHKHAEQHALKGETAKSLVASPTEEQTCNYAYHKVNDCKANRQRQPFHYLVFCYLHTLNIQHLTFNIPHSTFNIHNSPSVTTSQSFICAPSMVSLTIVRSFCQPCIPAAPGLM